MVRISFSSATIIFVRSVSQNLRGGGRCPVAYLPPSTQPVLLATPICQHPETARSPSSAAGSQALASPRARTDASSRWAGAPLRARAAPASRRAAGHARACAAGTAARPSGCRLCGASLRGSLASRWRHASLQLSALGTLLLPPCGLSLA